MLRKISRGVLSNRAMFFRCHAWIAAVAQGPADSDRRRWTVAVPSPAAQLARIASCRERSATTSRWCRPDGRAPPPNRPRAPRCAPAMFRRFPIEYTGRRPGDAAIGFMLDARQAIDEKK
ncbi:hypothetical protein ACQZ32_07385 [Ralstonia pseudosolanacearum]|uniref:Uncharacterized protein n=1 Tax=Ralstonia nicotianae (strain ATCC BAA-1114 / GMI1000) TaxID=267608 RepID=Q8XQ72_RALN1|nr:hypothetical protein [Ralstonia pseudosolanacearum]AST30364.1 hypothetical protein CDC45_24745 [Ralstonia pseudosolanacearum]MDC6286626.1 hypothetical protein [Ralstonia pseudosolanacearum]MDC6296112.1 hypothetical protein [Ralstonia pseudosolanacearum]MDD7791954.1 hypothetical protein [Ralstonia pseudosolanacearum]MDN3366448.1 hypothetical protein [Ralstonia pseudosolanacearum]